jgi:hypothetical protein
MAKKPQPIMVLVAMVIALMDAKCEEMRDFVVVRLRARRKKELIHRDPELLPEFCQYGR